jgi:predicted nucleotidyltransferase
MKEFIYHINGTEITDTEAFGKAWTKAKELATEEHTCITRTVIRDNQIEYEFYAKGGCFLNERFYEKERVKIF